MIIVDTGYLLALGNPRDSLHQRAQGWSPVIPDRWVTTEYVLWEMVNTFSMPRDRPKAHAMLAQIRSGQDGETVPASAALFEAGIRLHAERSDKEWSLTDCISFLVMNERGISRALTFDRHFEQAGFEALLRREPP